jgi:dihydrofolate reductase
MKYMVVAMDEKYGIGANNDLLWQRNLPADLAHFKQLTIGKSVIMGRKTFESILASLGKPLPDRQNIVLSSKPTGIKGVLTAYSLEAAYALAQYDIAVIGGGKVFNDAFLDMDAIFVTEVKATFPEATVFFPEINLKKWQEVSRESHDADSKNKYAYDFVKYVKIS